MRAPLVLLLGLVIAGPAAAKAGVRHGPGGAPFHPFRGMHTTSHRGGLGAYPHAPKPAGGFSPYGHRPTSESRATARS